MLTAGHLLQALPHHVRIPIIVVSGGDRFPNRACKSCTWPAF